MAIVLVSIPGSPSANSYVQTVDVDAYALGAFDAATWAALALQTDKDRFTYRAARLLDQLAYFPGRRVDTIQVMQWPRIFVPQPAYGYYDPTIIPQVVKDAQSQLAIYLATQATATEDVFGLLGTASLNKVQVGPINIDFKSDKTTDGFVYFNTVIAPILEAGGCIRAEGRLVR